MKNKKLKELVEDGTPKLLILKEKHGDCIYIVNNEKELHIACKSILESRVEQNWFYRPPNEPENTTGFTSPEEVQALPEGDVKDAALNVWGRYERRLKEYEDAVDLCKEVDAAISYEFNKADKYYTRNQAFYILHNRSRYEYECITLESPCKVPNY